MLRNNNLSHTEPMLDAKLRSIWLLLAISCIVQIEPAPYDLYSILLIIVFFAFGLKVPPHLSTPLTLLTLFILANFLSAMFSPDPLRCLRYMAITIFLILSWLFYASIIYADPERVYRVIWSGYIFSAIIAVIIGLIGYLKLIPQYQLFMSWNRVQGPFKDPNVYSTFLIPPILYLMYLLEEAKPGQFIVKLAIMLFLTLGVLLSFSRGAWFNLILSTLIYVSFRLFTARSKSEISGLITVGGIISLASVIVLVYAITATEISEVFFQRASLTQKYDTESGGRFDILALVLQQVFQTPMGVGPGESGHALSLDPHNLYIHITYETGWLGGIAFCSFLIITVWNGFLFSLTKTKLQGAFIVVFACLLGTLIESIIIHSTHWRHLYLMLGMLWGTMAAKEKLLP